MFHILTSSRAKRGDRKILRLISRFASCNDGVVSNKAFTLAEVLITLLIIGVVASMVIPNIINDVQDAELKTAWKKAYAEFSQATALIVSDNAGSLANVCPNPAVYTCMRDLYLQYMPYLKKCTDGIIDGCQYTTYKNLNGNNNNASNSASAILKNGSLILFSSVELPDCPNNNGPNVKNACGFMIIDVNGWKQPNTLGKDIFEVWVTRTGLKPYGTAGDNFDGTCVVNGGEWWGSGQGCAAKYLY